MQGTTDRHRTGYRIHILRPHEPNSFVPSEIRKEFPHERNENRDGTVRDQRQYSIQQKETFQKAVQSELAEMQIKITELQKKTNAASAEARSDMQKALQELEHKKEEARKQLDQVNESTSSAWSKLKDNMNAAVEDLKKSYTETVSKLP